MFPPSVWSTVCWQITCLYTRGPTNVSICRYYWLILAYPRYIGIYVYVPLYTLTLKLFCRELMPLRLQISVEWRTPKIYEKLNKTRKIKKCILKTFSFKIIYLKFVLYFTEFYLCDSFKRCWTSLMPHVFNHKNIFTICRRRPLLAHLYTNTDCN